MIHFSPSSSLFSFAFSLHLRLLHKTRHKKMSLRALVTTNAQSLECNRVSRNRKSRTTARTKSNTYFSHRSVSSNTAIASSSSTSSTSSNETKTHFAASEKYENDETLSATASIENLGKRGKIATGQPFLDHMIDQLTAHAQIGVSVQVSKRFGTNENVLMKSDCDEYAIDADAESTFRASGEAIGKALRKMLSEECGGVKEDSDDTKEKKKKKKNSRVRFAAPLDEAYASCEIERFDAERGEGELKIFEVAPYGPRNRTHIGKYPTKYTEVFFGEVAKNSGLTMTLKKHRGDNAHHIVEATFKSFARCLRKFMDESSSSSTTTPRTTSNAIDNNNNKRAASKARSTKETSIDVSLDLDRQISTSNNNITKGEIATGIKTLDFLFEALADEAEFGEFKCVASGDVWIDDHHTTEDVAITIGQCLNEALGNKSGCNRMGSATAIVNESEVEVIMDLSNRPYLGYDLDFANDSIGDLSCEMIEHLFMSVTFNGQMTVHVVTKEKGNKDEDLAEAAIRAFGKCFKQCKTIDSRRAGAVASSKGTLSV